MAIALDAPILLIVEDDSPPITVDWSTTIQSLSTDLQDYALRTLELTATKEMYERFFGIDTKRHETTATIEVEKPLSVLEDIFATNRTDRFAYGASVVVGILAGQTTLDKAADLVKGLRGAHKRKVKYIKKSIEDNDIGKNRNRTILKHGFNLHQSRHSFSVGEIHLLASSL